MYTLYTDKNEIFECEVSIKNASLKDSFVRMIVESSSGLSLLFEGELQNGKCIIPIKKLKGLLNESDNGKMKLEIIAESTYFKPWESEFVVEEHTNVKVKVKEQKELSSKPIVEVNIKNSISKKPSVPTQEIISICEKFDITSKNYKNTKRDDFKQLVREYFNYNKNFKNNITPILNEVISLLS